MRYKQSGLILLVVVASCQSEAPRTDTMPPDAAVSCTEMDLLSQVECFAALAVENDDVGECDAALHEGVRYQCYAVVAERQDDPLICAQIPSTSADHAALKDLCVGDIAKNRLDPELCATVGMAGIRDGCYLSIAEGIPDISICDRISEDGLKRLCLDTKPR